MAENIHDDQHREGPGKVVLRADGPITASVEVSTPELIILPADDILVEDSEQTKYLHLKNGSFSCHKSVYLMVDGKKSEVTTIESQFP